MSPRVLLVDDDRLQHRLTRAHFGRFGAQTWTLDGAETYEEGLRLLLEGDYAACLLDYRLGARDGLQLLREAMAAGCTTPIIFLTAEDSGGVDEEAMRAGALDYLLKSEITPGLLERSLRYAVNLGGVMAALRRLATRDELTGLLNRREFDRLLGEEVERARRFSTPLGLVVADFDRFKEVNDSFGHPAGDRALREFARRIEGCARSVDRVGRLGGDEFGILLVHTDREGARAAAERIRAAVGAGPVEVAPGQRVTVTASAGAAVFPESGSTQEALVAAADRALYAAKGAGRDRAVGPVVPGAAPS